MLHVDTAGQERFRTITSSYYRGAHGILLVFDVTDASSFTDIKQWYKEVQRYACENVPIAIVGLNIENPDRRVVSKETAESLADEYGTRYFEASVRTGQGVNEPFFWLGKNVIQRLASVPKTTKNPKNANDNVDPGEAKDKDCIIC